MPVSIKPSAHGANALAYQHAKNASDVLKHACPKEEWKCLDLCQSSFDHEGLLSTLFLPAMMDLFSILLAPIAITTISIANDPDTAQYIY